MRTYGRFLKNMAAIAILFALLSLLLPFCQIPAEGQKLVLSGMDVVRAGGRAGYTYFATGSIPDTFVLKAPVTIGMVKSALSYAQGEGWTRILLLSAAMVLIPVLIAFLSMCMLFLAEGKKTMVFPTLFTTVIVLELAVIFVCLPALKLFFKIGIYLFAFLMVAALVLTVLGWVTGGYQRPDPEETNRQTDKNRDDEHRRNSRSRWPRRKSKARRGRNKKKRGRKSSKNEKSSGSKKQNTDSKKPEDKKTQQEQDNTYEWKDCQISYDSGSRMYRIVNQSVDDVLLFKEEQMIEVLRPKDRVRVERPVTLQVQGTKDRLRLR